MNFKLTQIPAREQKPRKSGLTMVMDKGLSLGEAENFISVGGLYTDMIKLGFGTSYVTPNLRNKIEFQYFSFQFGNYHNYNDDNDNNYDFERIISY